MTLRIVRAYFPVQEDGNPGC